MEIKIFGIKIRINKEYLVLGAVIAVVVIGFMAHRYLTGKSGIIINASANDGKANMEIISSGLPAHEEEEGEIIQVYVVGCVNNPGVVTLKKGQIILDAIEAAGGATDDADIENINLAYKLYSNVMIRVKPVGEEEGTAAQGSSEAGSGAEIIEDSGGALNGTTSGGGKLNINHASVQELQQLPGIGEVTARDIVDYRKNHGPFKTIDDIMNVRGIKEGKFESIRDLITVE